MNAAYTITTTIATITTTTSFSTNTTTITTSQPGAVNGVEVAAVVLELVLEHGGGGEVGQVPEGGQVQGEGAERWYHGAEWQCLVGHHALPLCTIGGSVKC